MLEGPAPFRTLALFLLAHELPACGTVDGTSGESVSRDAGAPVAPPEESTPTATGSAEAPPVSDARGPPDPNSNPNSAGDDSAGPDSGNDPQCLAACDSVVPDPLTCQPDARRQVVADCARRCTELTDGFSESCAECMRDSMEFQHDPEAACLLGPPRVFVGLTGTCALGHCDVPYICYMPASCGEDSQCVRPCLVDGGGVQWGFCTFPSNGTCECETNVVTRDDCTNGAPCLCPSCGTGTGLCLTEPQRERVCIEGYVEQYTEAQARFACGK